MSSPKVGILEWFHLNEHDRVEQVIQDCKALGITSIRTGISWADYKREEGGAWTHWLLERLARDLEVIPCFLYTPPTEGVAPKTSSPPKNLKSYADFLDVVVTNSGQHFEYVELWNEANNLSEWDWTLDPQWSKFCEMVGGAAYWMKHLGKKTILGGMSPVDPYWLNLMAERGVLQYIDVVGVHGFPTAWEFAWEGWDANIAKAQSVLDAWQSLAEIWITETGHSTWRHDEFKQLKAFVDMLDAPVPRAFWYGMTDLHQDLATVDGFHSDTREYHFGLKKDNGTPKLLYRIWEEKGLEGVREAMSLETAKVVSSPKKPALICGGAGFIGTNLADRLASQGQPVIIFDNLARPGVENNLDWLKKQHAGLVEVHVADMLDRHSLRGVVEKAGQAFNFAAQVAVTTSLVDPVDDFDRNARGALNLLEEIRRLDRPVPLVFTSTNKVYGGLEDIPLRLRGNRYEPVDADVRAHGVSEARPLDFHSPYGCSKGAADQYVVDYARTFNMPTLVFRMSCIYGYHQCGTEDQGWVAHFLIQALKNRPITLYGDGKQVRDILFAEDLVDAFLLGQKNMAKLQGQAFNMGGGAENTISLIELLDMIEELSGNKVKISFDQWRPGDQRYYVSDTSKFRSATGWKPKFSATEGVKALFKWLGGSVPESVEALTDEKVASL